MNSTKRRQKSSRIPSYRIHKPSRQAVVTLDGREIYLGRHGTEKSRTEYNRLIAEWIANGWQLPADGAVQLTVTEVVARYWRYAQGYYHKNDEPTSELHCMRMALRPLKRLYGHSVAKDFGPLALKAIRQAMIDQRWRRGTVNAAVNRIRRVMKWAAENELVPPSVYHGLVAVSGLRAGRSEARESEPVRPVPDDDVDAIRRFASRQVWAMIELQRFTGMRPGEVTMMRGGDLDTSGKVWTYTPETHKTAHHGHDRVIYLGPRAQAIVKPFLKRDLTAYLFSPIEAEQERHDQIRERRRARVQPSQARRAARARWRAERGQRQRPPSERYTVASYHRAIARACDKAFLHPELSKIKPAKLTDEQRVQLERWRKDHRWHPHQLRHNAATRMRKEYGLDAARVILGHKSAAVTEVYAEIDAAKAVEIMAKVG